MATEHDHPEEVENLDYELPPVVADSEDVEADDDGWGVDEERPDADDDDVQDIQVGYEVEGDDDE